MSESKPRRVRLVRAASLDPARRRFALVLADRDGEVAIDLDRQDALRLVGVLDQYLAWRRPGEI